MGEHVSERLEMIALLRRLRHGVEQTGWTILRALRLAVAERSIKERCLSLCADVAAEHQATIDDQEKDVETRRNAAQQQFAALHIAANIRNLK